MPVQWLSEAELELTEAVFYYEDCRTGLGSRFHAAVSQVITQIGERPDAFPLYEAKRTKRPYRRARIPRFPYLVVFEIRPTEVLIVAVPHTSRLPGYWANRE